MFLLDCAIPKILQENGRWCILFIFDGVYMLQIKGLACQP
jgi:hypothetical protein